MQKKVVRKAHPEQSRRILLAEDDDGIIQVVTLILEGEGYTVSVARNEQEVRASLAQELPQILLLDVSLSGSDGGSLAKQLKNAPETKSLPIVIASANSETEKIAKESGSDGFLLKPFEIETLLSTVRQYT